MELLIFFFIPPDATTEHQLPFCTDEDSTPDMDEGKFKSYAELITKDGDSGPKNSLEHQQYDETSDLYLM